MKKNLVNMKNFVVKHRSALMGAITGIAVTTAIITRIALAQHDQFLLDHGLFDEYYTPETEI